MKQLILDNMEKYILKFQQLITKYWFALVGFSAVVFALVNYLSDLGVAEAFPNTVVSIVGTLNLIAALFGLPQIQIPQDFPKTKEEVSNE